MKIVILSREPDSYTTKRLVSAARKAKHKVYIIDHTKCYVEIEKSKPEVHYNGQTIKGIDAIIPRIGASVTAYGSAIVRQFEMRNVYSSAKSLAIVRASDKLRTLQLLAREGLGIPKTVFARKPEDINDVLELVGGAPVIVKLVEGTRGRGVVLAETRKAAKSVIQAFYSLNANILIQEYVEESGGADIRALVVGSKVVASMKRQGLDEEFRSNIHLGGRGEPVELSKEERRTAVLAARKLGLDIAGVDMIRSDRGPLVIEVNSSPGLEGIEKTSKVDVAKAIIEHVETSAVKKPKKDAIGA